MVSIDNAITQQLDLLAAKLLDLIDNLSQRLAQFLSLSLFGALTADHRQRGEHQPT